MRGLTLFIASVVLLPAVAPHALGQDNPATRAYLSRLLKAKLAEHRSKETAFRNENRDTHEIKKTVEIPLVGEETVVDTQVDVETKTWIWFDDPDKDLSVDVRQFRQDGDRWEFEVAATGHVRGEAWGKIPNIGEGDIGLKADAEILVAGSFTLDDAGRIADTKISKLKGQLQHLDSNNDLVSELKGYVEKRINDWLKGQANGKFREEIQATLNGQELPL